MKAIINDGHPDDAVGVIFCQLFFFLPSRTIFLVSFHLLSFYLPYVALCPWHRVTAE